MKGATVAAAVSTTGLLPVSASATPVLSAQAAIGAAADSDLIYITALKADGGLGRCQAEVWFVPMGGDFVVVTSADSWRVKAAAKSQAAKIWVGDVGPWQGADGKYRGLPSLQAQTGRIDDKESQTAALQLMGKKYRGSWLLWGPRFRNGLADGSRVMLRYRPTS